MRPSLLPLALLLAAGLCGTVQAGQRARSERHTPAAATTTGAASSDRETEKAQYCDRLALFGYEAIKAKEASVPMADTVTRVLAASDLKMGRGAAERAIQDIYTFSDPADKAAVVKAKMWLGCQELLESGESLPSP